MKYKRLLRDVGILSLFVAGFFLFTQAINLLGEDIELAPHAEFSESRRQADRYVVRKDYKTAANFLAKLTEEDKYNSHAWYQLGVCNANLYFQSKKPTMANDLTPNSKENLAAQKEYAKQALAAFERVLDYPRYRVLAIQRIAAIHTQEGNLETALDYLEKATLFPKEIQTHYYVWRDYYGPLYDEPRFKEIERTFRKNAKQFRRRVRTNRRIGVLGRANSAAKKSAGDDFDGDSKNRQ